MAAAAAGNGEALVVKEKVLATAAGEGSREGEAPAVEGRPAIAAEGSGVAEEEEEEEGGEEGVRWIKHYSSVHSMLVVGDGDFSFSRALAAAFGSGENLVATSLDSYASLKSKYSKAESNIMELKRLGATVLHGVDAKTMKLHTDLKMRRFDRIVFNFPHAGFKGKEDQVHMINLHRELVRYFFHNSSRLLRPYGEIHVSHKIGPPYDRWDIKQLAAESSLVLVEQVGFQKGDYPGYNQKRGDGANCDQPFKLGACCTFKFCRGNTKKMNKVHRNRTGSLPSLGVRIDDTTGRAPFHPLPLVLPWSLPRYPPPVHAIPMPIALEPYPLGVAQRQHPDFLANFRNIVTTPHLHQQGSLRPMFSIPEPQLNVLSTLAGISPPSRVTGTTLFAPQQQHLHEQRPILPLMSSITRTTLLAPQQQPLYQQRPTLEPPLGRVRYTSIAEEYIQRGHEIQRRAMPMMPRGTSLDHQPAFLDHRFRESFSKEEWLERLIAFYRGPC